uniref:TOG domain-containing protein n=1 Tax=Panagrolaimus sp. ES5 TaxID=591445 RepID=A0AC34FZ85_9BILA
MSSTTRLLRSSPPSGAGAVSEADFLEAFAQTQPEKLSDSQALLDRLNGINLFLINPNNDWAKKVKMLGNLRGCIISNVPHSLDIVLDNIALWKKCLIDGLKELRSTLTREYCITIAFFAVKLRSRLMPLVEQMFTNLMNLVKSSTKIISSSAIVLSELISKYVNHSSLIPMTFGYMSSKSGPVKANVENMLCIMLLNWDKNLLTPHINIIKNIIKTGLTDANAETRTAAKDAYFAFYDKFSLQALQLYESLDSSRQKALNHSKSAALSSHSLSRQNSVITTPKPKPFIARTPSFTPQSLSSSSSSNNNNTVAKTNGFSAPRRVTNIRKPSPIRQNRSAEAPAVLKSNGTRQHSIPRVNGNYNGNYLHSNGITSSSQQGLKHQIPLIRPNQPPSAPASRPSRVSVFGTIRSNSLPRTISDSALGSSNLKPSNSIEKRMLKT